MQLPTPYRSGAGRSRTDKFSTKAPTLQAGGDTCFPICSERSSIYTSSRRLFKAKGPETSCRSPDPPPPADAENQGEDGSRPGGLTSLLAGFSQLGRRLRVRRGLRGLLRLPGPGSPLRRALLGEPGVALGRGGVRLPVVPLLRPGAALGLAAVLGLPRRPGRRGGLPGVARRFAGGPLLPGLRVDPVHPATVADGGELHPDVAVLAGPHALPR